MLTVDLDPFGWFNHHLTVGYTSILQVTFRFWSWHEMYLPGIHAYPQG
jgi:hypothetical protein